MSLSTDQQVAYDYAVSQRTGSILITGHAGCGKTYVARRIVEDKLDKGADILCLAPTHQAKLQFSQALPSNVKVSTIASFLNVKAKKNEITGEIEFSEGFLDRTSNKKYHLIVVDECSMIGEEDLNELVKLKKDSLLIFLGDFNQLSPVLKKDGSEIFKTMRKFELVEQHRNAGTILKLCDLLRNYEIYPEVSEDGIEVHSSREDFLVEMINKIKDDPDPYNISYLAFTNAAVKEVRNLIHTILYNNDIVNAGQYLRLESRTNIGNRSEIIEIIDVRPSKRIILDTEVTQYDVTAENIFSADRAKLKILSYTDQDKIEAIAKECYKELSNLWNTYRANPNNEANKTKWKDMRALLNEVDEITMTSSPFALTIHKSQGRTIPTVFLDTQNINIYGRDIKTKLLYVGASRTKSDLHTIKV